MDDGDSRVEFDGTQDYVAPWYMEACGRQGQSSYRCWVWNAGREDLSTDFEGGWSSRVYLI